MEESLFLLFTVTCNAIQIHILTKNKSNLIFKIILFKTTKYKKNTYKLAIPTKYACLNLCESPYMVRNIGHSTELAIRQQIDRRLSNIIIVRVSWAHLVAAHAHGTWHT